ncbi:chromatin associated protein KTI12 [Cutaneotrichosporon oleaginosum]|uniref:Chromatin associated protein KTI12 n=1 Tax=Cutaneotrichosporon oleaginosum TaxID=879819 RepID=A0A0J0XGD7_9TREE|nr:chromatin associated protein KTI12 [Cutaneotrichosporon oleaginosum]KLT40128.1 chromatin associated protein KTI12 [Cutaneotrichosporon oleaginosum]TXT04765.1 hypothetical protein COLE_07584 [Cutaneotrichosporon oleaginosum]
MALITVSGFPCSGKSTRAQQLRDYLQERIDAPDYQGPKFDVVLVDDAACHVSRSAYDDSKTEKPARAALFTAATRALRPDSITILDSANYIKGFRYQLYCAAREAGVRVATIRVAAPPNKCAEWHAARPEGERYTDSTFDNLIQRYEEPNSMVRWDSPLFTVSWDEELPAEDIWRAIRTGEKRPPNQAVNQRSAPPPGTLQTLTRTTSTIVSALLAHLAGGQTPTFPIPSPPARQGLVLHLPGHKPTLSEMQRLKRQFEATQTGAQRSGGGAAGSWTEPEVAANFVTFLENVWETN